MEGLRISELARRVGVPVSTVRYYERVGVMPEPQRTESGYRTYDAAAEARLLFISRAKRFGLGLDEITELAEAWDDTNCGATRERLGTLLAAKRIEIAEQIRELEVFSGQLADVEARLAVDDGPAECAPDLACCTPELDGPTTVTLGTKPAPDSAPIACTLDVDERPERLDEFSALAADLTGWSRDESSLRLTFRPHPQVAARVRSLTAKEERCCSFLAFEVREEPDRVEWIVQAPSVEAAPTLDEFLPLLEPALEGRIT